MKSFRKMRPRYEKIKIQGEKLRKEEAERGNVDVEKEALGDDKGGLDEEWKVFE